MQLGIKKFLSNNFIFAGTLIGLVISILIFIRDWYYNVGYTELDSGSDSGSEYSDDSNNGGVGYISYLMTFIIISIVSSSIIYLDYHYLGKTINIEKIIEQPFPSVS